MNCPKCNAEPNYLIIRTNRHRGSTFPVEVGNCLVKPSTSAALSKRRTRRAARDQSVIGCELMAFHATVRARSNGTKSIPAIKVLSGGHRLQVSRIDAACDSTQVVDHKAVGDRTNIGFINEPVGLRLFPVNPHAPVSVPVHTASPQPAANSLHESLVQ